MAFSDIQIQTLAQAAVDACHAEVAPLTLFSHSYNSEIEGTYGQAVAVPTTDLSAGEFDASVGYCGTNEYGAEIVTLSSQPVASMRISDKKLAETGVDFAKDAGRAIGGAIGRKLFADAVTAAAGTTLTATWDLSAPFALPEKAMDKDLPVKESVAIVSPAAWTAILKETGTYHILGTDEFIRDGIARNVMGFKAIVPTAKLPNGVKAIVIPANSLATAVRPLPPVFTEGMQYKQATDDATGVTFGLREFVDNCSGYGYVAGSALAGTKKIGKILKLS